MDGGVRERSAWGFSMGVRQSVSQSKRVSAGAEHPQEPAARAERKQLRCCYHWWAARLQQLEKLPGLHLVESTEDFRQAEEARRLRRARRVEVNADWRDKSVAALAGMHATSSCALMVVLNRCAPREHRWVMTKVRSSTQHARLEKA